ncbi:MAG: amidotransferase [Bacteroidetes bacterium SW_9_63_38]|nr:MAG: amidotransferase [Bacteroidetes bacterium SW_9_63_38]
MPDVLILQHVRPEPPGTIADALEDRGLSYDTVQVYRDDPVPDTLEADGLVVMGGPMGVGDIADRPHLQTELGLVEQALDTDRPVLGTCLGSQLLAHVLGADVHPGDGKELGWGEVTLTEAAAGDPLWTGVEDPFTAFHWHGDVFELPDGAVRLAASTQTEQQAFRYGDHAYGILFHLEVTPKTVAGMTTAFQDELAEEGLDGAAIRRAAMTHEDAVRDTAATVFGRWAELCV